EAQQLEREAQERFQQQVQNSAQQAWEHSQQIAEQQAQIERVQRASQHAWARQPAAMAAASSEIQGQGRDGALGGSSGAGVWPVVLVLFVVISLLVLGLLFVLTNPAGV